MITTPTVGQLNWGGPLNNQLEILARDGLNANDHGLLAWNYQPAQAAQALAAVSGQVRLTRMPHLPEAMTITNVAMFVNVAQAGGVVGQNFLGLYSMSGTLLGTTADATAAFSTVGAKIIPLTAPVVVPIGGFYTALLVNAGTPLQFTACASLAAGMTNFNQTADTGSFVLAAGAHTVLPASITMATNTLTSFGMWMGVS